MDARGGKQLGLVPPTLLIFLTIMCLGCANGSDDPKKPTAIVDGGPEDQQLVVQQDTNGPACGSASSTLNDGEITRDELNFVTGLSATVLVNAPNSEATLDSEGKLIDGQVHWDFTSMEGVSMEMKVEPVTDFWFSQYFPEGDLAMAVTVGADTLQILKVEQDRVLLLGLASREPHKTLTIYEPPIEAMRFPLKRGLKFSSSASLKDGSKIDGLPFYSIDTYEISINTMGVLHLPKLTLNNVLLIETLVTIKTLGGVTKSSRQLQWFAECYGEVVRALSTTDEPEPLFTKAFELRRLTF